MQIIVNRFNKHSLDFDKLLSSLCALDGLGVVISSGLIYTAYPNYAVPFDKYTMGYSLREKILYSQNLSTNSYADACAKVLDYIENNSLIHSILDFVRTAGNTNIDKEILDAYKPIC